MVPIPIPQAVVLLAREVGRLPSDDARGALGGTMIAGGLGRDLHHAEATHLEGMTTGMIG